jgi:hypothetical protein
MVFNFLTIFFPNWNICLFGLSFDEARNMTGRDVSVMTRLQDFMHDKCFFFHIWCKVHQLDLVMEHIMNEVVKKRFF